MKIQRHDAVPYVVLILLLGSLCWAGAQHSGKFIVHPLAGRNGTFISNLSYDNPHQAGVTLF